MKHEKYKELLELHILNELENEEILLLENHLLECEECSRQFNEMKKINNFIASGSPKELTAKDLAYSRNKLFESINILEDKPSFISKFLNNFNNTFSLKYNLAFGSVLLLLLGLLIGYLVFKKEEIKTPVLAQGEINLDEINSGKLQIAKVTLPEIFSESGEYAIKVGTENSIIYKGTLEDKIIQKLLAAAIKKTNNPGFKIKTAASIKEFMPKNFKPDSAIENSFILSLKNDKNPGVRKTALQALINFPFNEKIRDALIYTLDNDDNASIRIEAINALLSMSSKSQLINEKVKNKIANNDSNEDNEVVKVRKETLLLKGK